MNDEILVPLDLSDAIALIDRQKQQIAALKAERDKALSEIDMLIKERRELSDKAEMLELYSASLGRVIDGMCGEFDR